MTQWCCKVSQSERGNILKCVILWLTHGIEPVRLKDLFKMSLLYFITWNISNLRKYRNVILKNTQEIKYENERHKNQNEEKEPRLWTSNCENKLSILYRLSLIEPYCTIGDRNFWIKLSEEKGVVERVGRSIFFKVELGQIQNFFWLWSHLVLPLTLRARIVRTSVVVQKLRFHWKLYKKDIVYYI